MLYVKTFSVHALYADTYLIWKRFPYMCYVLTFPVHALCLDIFRTCVMWGGTFLYMLIVQIFPYMRYIFRYFPYLCHVWILLCAICEFSSICILWKIFRTCLMCELFRANFMCWISRICVMCKFSNSALRQLQAFTGEPWWFEQKPVTTVTFLHIFSLS